MGITHIITQILEQIEATIRPKFQRVQFVKQVVWPFGKYRFAILLLLSGTLQMACTTAVEENTENIEKSEITAPVEATSKQIVEIKGMKFNPDMITSSIGDTVIFVNKDLVPHNVTDRADSDTLSPSIAPNTEWMLIVTKNLRYYCSLHPNMEGEIQLANP